MAAAACALRALLLCAVAAAALAVDCVAAPKNAACANFKLPAAVAAADVAALCKGAPQLPGCSLAKACSAAGAAAKVGATPGVCDAFRQLATVCGKDPAARSLPGCKARYVPLCLAPGSVVKQCREAAPLPLVSGAEAAKQVRSICDEMEMEGCERCAPGFKAGRPAGGPKCDIFAVYGWLCVQMPDMQQCIGRGRWDDMCKRLPNFYACTGNSVALTDKAWRW